ncbi:unnamed protein product, partial [Iphiclides podalirius]
MDHLKLTFDKLSVEYISDLVLDNSCGAISVFVGTTRDNFEGKKVVKLEYEAYEPMALKAMKSICDEIRSKWPAVHGIAIYHRLGAVACREASVVVAVSSPRRAEATAAAAHCVDRLKATVPVWKREHYAGGHQPQWKENQECPSQQSPQRSPSPHIPETATDRNLIQINVSNEELQQRIQNFIERKRDQVNVSNIADFIPGHCESETQDTETCARVRTQFVKRSDSKGHLKSKLSIIEEQSRFNFVVSILWFWSMGGGILPPSHIKVIATNMYRREKGEPMRGITNVRSPQGAQRVGPADGARGGGWWRWGGGALPGAVAERLRAAEGALGVAPVGSDVYRRLKAVEDRLAHLHALSPEYAHFWNVKQDSTEVKQESAEYVYSAEDIARKIEQLEKQASA